MSMFKAIPSSSITTNIEQNFVTNQQITYINSVPDIINNINVINGVLNKVKVYNEKPLISNGKFTLSKLPVSNTLIFDMIIIIQNIGNNELLVIEEITEGFTVNNLTVTLNTNIYNNYNAMVSYLTYDGEIQETPVDPDEPTEYDSTLFSVVDNLDTTLSQENGLTNFEKYQVTAYNLSDTYSIYVNEQLQVLESTIGSNQEIIKVSIGWQHTAVVLNDGTLKMIGSNNYGQLGMGHTNAVTTWTDSNISNVKDVSCGRYHTIISLTDGTVKTAGYNNNGQLGTGNNDASSSWVDGGLTNIINVYSGEYHSVALSSDGSVKVTGDNSLGQLGLSNNIDVLSWATSNISGVAKLYSGAYHMIAVSDNKLYCVGNNTYGQLGFGTTQNINVWTVNDIFDSLSIKEVRCGQHFSMVLLNDGTVKVAGRNYHGQLGVGNNENQLNWVNSNITNVKDIGCGWQHTIALLQDNSIKVVGDNTYGQLGIGDNLSKNDWVVSNLTGVKQVVASLYSTICVLTSDIVKVVGNDSAEHLGIPVITTTNTWVDTDIGNNIIKYIFTEQSTDSQTLVLNVDGTADKIEVEAWYPL